MYSHSTGSRGISSGMSYGKSGTNAASRPPQYSSSNIGVSTFGSSKPSRPLGSQVAGSSSSGLRSSNKLNGGSTLPSSSAYGAPLNRNYRDSME